MYYIIVNDIQQGPYRKEDLPSLGLKADTPVWKEGMENWQRADSVEELKPYFIRIGQPEHIPFPSYGGRKSQWMALSIVATVLGLCSCIGLVIGIIAIVKCSNANNYYRCGDNEMGERADASAKTLAIVALCFDGLGIVISAMMQSMSYNYLNMLQ